MAPPRDPKHRQVALALFAGNTAEQASESAGYDIKASSFGPNARKRAQREDIRSYLAELRSAPPSGHVLQEIERAEIQREYLLGQTWDELQFNFVDYLGPPDENGKRSFDVSLVPRHLMGRLDELWLAADGTVMKLKGPSKVVNRRFAADLQGFMQTKHEITGRDGGPIETAEVGDTEVLRRVAAFLRQRVPALEGEG